MIAGLEPSTFNTIMRFMGLTLVTNPRNRRTLDSLDVSTGPGYTEGLRATAVGALKVSKCVANLGGQRVLSATTIRSESVLSALTWSQGVGDEDLADE